MKATELIEAGPPYRANELACVVVDKSTNAGLSLSFYDQQYGHFIGPNGPVPNEYFFQTTKRTLADGRTGFIVGPEVTRLLRRDALFSLRASIGHSLGDVRCKVRTFVPIGSAARPTSLVAEDKQDVRNANFLGVNQKIEPREPLRETFETQAPQLREIAGRLENEIQEAVSILPSPPLPPTTEEVPTEPPTSDIGVSGDIDTEGSNSNALPLQTPSFKAKVLVLGAFTGALIFASAYVILGISPNTGWVVALIDAWCFATAGVLCAAIFSIADPPKLAALSSIVSGLAAFFLLRSSETITHYAWYYNRYGSWLGGWDSSELLVFEFVQILSLVQIFLIFKSYRPVTIIFYGFSLLALVGFLVTSPEHLSSIGFFLQWFLAFSIFFIPGHRLLIGAWPNLFSRNSRGNA